MATALAQIGDTPPYLREHRSIFSNLLKSKQTMYEWISDSNVLLALIILIIVIFLVSCILCFYCAFFPDGIPEDLKNDNASEARKSMDNDSEKMDEEKKS